MPLLPLMYVVSAAEAGAWSGVCCEACESFVSICSRHMQYKDSTQSHSQM